MASVMAKALVFDAYVCDCCGFHICLNCPSSIEKNLATA